MEDLNHWLCQECIKNKTICNFSFFDYRGVADSKGPFKDPKNLVVDGSSIVQFVRAHLKTPPGQIHFYGVSLGGAIAAETQALDPDRLVGRHLNERSFASSDKLIKAISGSCLGTLLSRIVKIQGYSINTVEAFDKLKGQKLVVYHPEDQAIPYSASLQQEIQHDAVICLEPRAGRRETGETYADASRRKYHHNAPATWYEGAADRMGKFLFGIPSAQEKSVV